ncbi:hypothetical protein LTR95_001710 [Oleoguttula sp. CCFEE 5521]
MAESIAANNGLGTGYPDASPHAGPRTHNFFPPAPDTAGASRTTISTGTRKRSNRCGTQSARPDIGSTSKVPCTACWAMLLKKSLRDHYATCTHINKVGFDLWACAICRKGWYYDCKAYIQYLQGHNSSHGGVRVSDQISTPHVTEGVWTTVHFEDAVQRQVCNLFEGLAELDPLFVKKWKLSNQGILTPQFYEFDVDKALEASRHLQSPAGRRDSDAFVRLCSLVHPSSGPAVPPQGIASSPTIPQNGPASPWMMAFASSVNSADQVSSRQATAPSPNTVHFSRYMDLTFAKPDQATPFASQQVHDSLDKVPAFHLASGLGMTPYMNKPGQIQLPALQDVAGDEAKQVSMVSGSAHVSKLPHSLAQPFQLSFGHQDVSMSDLMMLPHNINHAPITQQQQDLGSSSAESGDRWSFPLEETVSVSGQSFAPNCSTPAQNLIDLLSILGYDTSTAEHPEDRFLGQPYTPGFDAGVLQSWCQFVEGFGVPDGQYPQFFKVRE